MKYKYCQSSCVATRGERGRPYVLELKCCCGSLVGFVLPELGAPLKEVLFFFVVFFTSLWIRTRKMYECGTVFLLSLIE